MFNCARVSSFSIALRAWGFVACCVALCAFFACVVVLVFSYVVAHCVRSFLSVSRAFVCLCAIVGAFFFFASMALRRLTNDKKSVFNRGSF